MKTDLQEAQSIEEQIIRTSLSSLKSDEREFVEGIFDWLVVVFGGDDGEDEDLVALVKTDLQEAQSVEAHEGIDGERCEDKRPRDSLPECGRSSTALRAL